MVFKAVLLAAVACIGTTSALELTPGTYAEATAGKRLLYLSATTAAFITLVHDRSVIVLWMLACLIIRVRIAYKKQLLYREGCVFEVLRPLVRPLQEHEAGLVVVCCTFSTIFSIIFYYPYFSKVHTF
jgi:hypothetical protein